MAQALVAIEVEQDGERRNFHNTETIYVGISTSSDSERESRYSQSHRSHRSLRNPHCHRIEDAALPYRRQGIPHDLGRCRQ